ncbi:AMP-binding protein [Glaciimonas sp. GS1]|uniref:AMP-binding protein n=2 Tax=Glaciimonas soli TaxID=2590999 RepID=A0A843YXH5_9BURK|nr:AMP-binding protein [Glaciimonas soli]
MYHMSNVSKATPEKIAAIFLPSEQTLSYGELEASANQVANALHAQGVRRGDCIGICVGNSPALLSLICGAQRIGVYYTLMSTKLSADDFSYILQDAGATVAIISADAHPAPAVATMELITKAGQPINLFGIDMRDGALRDWDAICTAASTMLPAAPSPGREMLYSSGTTGRPKGVREPLFEGPYDVIDARNAGVAQVYGVTASSVFLSPCPLYHSGPNRFLSAALNYGATCVIFESFDAARALAAIGDYKCTHSLWVPTMFHRLLQLPAEQREAGRIESLRYAIHGAAPCPVHLKRRMIDWWGPIVDEYYSGTEGIGSTHISAAEWLAHEGSVGRPVGCAVHILGDDGEEVQIGDIGDVYFASTTEFEYWNDTQKTARICSRQGWRTFGDIGYVDADGYLYLTGRKDFTIISGGVNIYPQEIEDAILEDARVMDVAVFGVPNEEFGEEVKAVVQLLNPADASPSLAAALTQHVRQRLGPIKVPRSVDFVTSLPRHQTGKLYKKLLIDQHRQGS